MHRFPALILATVFGLIPSLQDTQPSQVASQAQAPATQPAPPPEALALLARLDDPDYAQREQAEDELLALVIAQPSLQPWVVKAAELEPSPEVRSRLASVLSQVAQHRLLGPTLVSLQVTDVHPRDLISELGRQSGVRFEYWPHDPWEVGGVLGGKVSLTLQAVPFWEAMRRVAEMTAISPVEHQPSAPGSIVLSQHGEQFGAFPTRHHGAFAIQLRRLHRNQTSQVELGLEPDGKIAGNVQSSSSLSLDIRLLVEPKVRLTGSGAQPILEEAIDESGNSLLIPSENQRMHGATGWSNSLNAWAVQSTFSLDAKAASASDRIARLRGRLEAEVATEVVKLDFKLSDLADLRRLRPEEKVPLAKRYTVGPYQIDLTSVRRAQDDSIYLDFTITPQSSSPEQLQDEWARMQALSNALRLEDAAGRLWPSAVGGTSWDGSSAQMSRGFHRGGESAGPAVRFVWEIPAKIMPVSIPFEFTDVPLPAWD